MKTDFVESLKVAFFEYDFALHGGAQGDITLRGPWLPPGAIVREGHIDVITAVTSDGAATIALKLEAAEDVLAATGKASFSLAAQLDTVPDGAAANVVRMTAKRQLIATVATADLTAGRFMVALFYFVTR